MLPDGITHTKGFVKDVDETKRYLSLDENEAPSSPEGGKDYADLQDGSDNPQHKRSTDLTNTVEISLFIMFEIYPYSNF